MNALLQTYLAAHPAHHETTERWPIQGELRVRLSLATDLPPAAASSSILAIVSDPDGRVLFLWPSEPTGRIAHFLIGGRPQAGETPAETVMCEVAEETGWQVKPTRMVGFRHFFHLEPRSEKSDRPYPDFIQPIFAARTAGLDSSRLLPNDHLPAEFIDFAVAERMTDPAQRPLLRAARAAS